MEDLISVIIPVYNVEMYLEKCINSIIKQIYNNIEIILVDDASTDNSGSICDQFAKKHNNIKIFHNTINIGAAASRNIGIEKSNGKYICFVDSDDEITENYVSYLHYLIKKYNTSMSISSYIICSRRKKNDIGRNYNEKRLTKAECLRRLLNTEGFSTSLWAKMYEKRIFDDIKIPEEKAYEDDAITYKIIMSCEHIAYGNESNYKYIIRDNSIMTKEFSKDRLVLLKYADEMYYIINREYPKLKKYTEKKYINYYFSILRQMINSNLNDEFIPIKKKIIMELKKYKKIILFSNIYGIKEKMGMITLLFGEKFYKFGWNIYTFLVY